MRSTMLSMVGPPLKARAEMRMSSLASIEVASSTAISESIPMSKSESAGSIRSGAMRKMPATSARTSAVNSVSASSAGSCPSQRRRSCAESPACAPRSPAASRVRSENFGACARWTSETCLAAGDRGRTRSERRIQ